MKVIELFGGIGAPKKALTNLGIKAKYEYVEIDKYATNSYNALYNENHEPISIMDFHSKWKKVDLVVGGFPCQDLSVAGKQKGLQEGTRSNLFNEMVRVCLETKPTHILFENVKQLLNEKHWPLFIKGISPLLEKGYMLSYQKINAKDFIPQNRERIFVLLSKTSLINVDMNKEHFKPITWTNDKGEFFKRKPILKDYLDFTVNDDWYFDICNSYMKKIAENDNHWMPNNKKFNKDSPFAYSITTKQKRFPNSGMIMYKDFKNFITLPDSNGNLINGSYNRVWKNDKFIGCLNTTAKIKIVNNEPFYIRYLTELECWRLMGFTDNDFNKASKVSNRTQLYKQAGNSIVVPVLEAIFKNILKEK